ncbi:hypothetical protein SAMN06265218_10190 [Fodinibius sediminis]|uniref:Uncharacterized protein n=1 Tax=Fodinibius sediminis TaxID=1214077 RepID=A0A521AG41_9BACT|nr:hypothetical protein SAMN06265218_10190 [Fodinibius sediminis]
MIDYVRICCVSVIFYGCHYKKFQTLGMELKIDTCCFHIIHKKRNKNSFIA